MRGLWLGLLLLAPLGACGGHDAHMLPGPIAALGEEAAETILVGKVKLSEGVFPCSRCHVGGEDVADTLPAMPHRLHLDRDLECADCHMPEDEPEPGVPPAEVCFDCHEDLKEESEAVRAYFRSTTDDKGGYAFPRRWKTRDVVPAHEKHAAAGVACELCHGEPNDLALKKPRPVPLMNLCVACHTERKVASECATYHTDTKGPAHDIELDHAEEQRGCLDCHNPDDRDTVRLADGTALPFEQSYLLCGQCHGTKLRDWRRGLHGKRMGLWDGQKRYLICAECHWPHKPRYPVMAPEPRPARPEEVE